MTVLPGHDREYSIYIIANVWGPEMFKQAWVIGGDSGRNLTPIISLLATEGSHIGKHGPPLVDPSHPL